MSGQESPFPKLPHSSSWNVVRSKSVPSGVSGSHSVAKAINALATDESVLNSKEPVTLRTRKSSPYIPTVDSTLLNQ